MKHNMAVVTICTCMLWLLAERALFVCVSVHLGLFVGISDINREQHVVIGYVLKSKVEYVFKREFEHTMY